MNTSSTKAYIYILSNKRRSVLYIGMTDSLRKRIYFHKKRLISGFTKKYNVDRLVYFEVTSCIEEASIREKQLKGWSRKKKIGLIEKLNAGWEDLYDWIQS